MMDMGGGMDHGGGSDCKISMLWNWYTVDACFLSTSWRINSDGAFAASCIGVVLLVVALEVLRRAGKEYDALILRQFQRRAAAQALALKDTAAATTATSCCAGDDEPVPTPQRPQVLTFRASPLQQLVRSVLYAVTFGVAYIVMLLAMYFNGYIIISIILGAGIGKFLCDWMVHRVVLGGEDDAKAQGIDEPTVCCG